MLQKVSLRKRSEIGAVEDTVAHRTCQPAEYQVITIIGVVIMLFNTILILVIFVLINLLLYSLQHAKLSVTDKFVYQLEYTIDNSVIF